jgi:23S rRNA U2552 (ribose-2'-O)-methylase RlmE/FtsJ
MDSTPELCAIGYSFSPNQPIRRDVTYLPTFSENTPKIQVIASTDFPNDVYVNYNDETVREIATLSALRERTFDKDMFEYASEATNPYRIGRSIFPMSEYSVVMANMDAYFNLTRVMSMVTSTEPYLPGELGEKGVNFRFCSLCDGPGGFTKYIQYRRPQSYGVGMSRFYAKDVRKQNWQPAELDMNRFAILEDDAKTGDLVKNYPRILEHVRSMTRQVDLVVCNGGVRQDEIASTRLILTEIYVTLMILGEGGDAVFRVTDLNTKAMLDAIYLLTYVFHQVTIFKPCSSRLTSMERYIVCKHHTFDKEWVRRAFAEAMQEMEGGGVLSSIISTEYPTEFMNVIHALQIEHLRECNIHTARALEYMETGVTTSGGLYDSDRFLIMWALPSNFRLYQPPTPLVPSKTTESLGRRVFEAYNYILVNGLFKISDRGEYTRALVNARSTLNRLIFGIDEGLKRLPNTVPWTHVREGDYYTFTSGALTYKCIAENIDKLVKCVSGDWNAIYRLVERYYPFTRVFLSTTSPGATIAFGNPLVHIGGKYCSLYDEDKIFGSLGVVDQVFPVEGEWVFYSHAMDNVLLNVARLCMGRVGDGAHVKVYTPVWPTNNVVKAMSLMKEPVTVQVVLRNHGNNSESPPTPQLLFEL